MTGFSRLARPGSWRNDHGTATLEFAVGAPLILILAVGVIQMGMALFAQAGLRSAVESGARYATIYPTPTDTQIAALAMQSAYGIDPTKVTGPTLSRGTANGVNYVDISMTYSLPLHFPFVKNQSINLSYGRRAYQY